MPTLNYHHLRYFLEVYRSGGVTKAATRLHVAPSAVSVQLRQLEDALGHPLFDRQNKALRLTEAGQLTLEYAEKIFRSGDELCRVLGRSDPHRTHPLRVGAVSTLSRNFILQFLRLPTLGSETQVVLQSGAERELLTAMRAHQLDVVLANASAPRGGDMPLHSDLIDEQSVSLVGHKRSGHRRAFRFPEDLNGRPLVLPGEDSGFRTAFERLLDRHGLVPKVIAEADDMALLRLLAREIDALALVPPVVVRDELNAGLLVEVYRFADITERFYAITPPRKFCHPLLPKLLQHPLPQGQAQKRSKKNPSAKQEA